MIYSLEYLKLIIEKKTSDDIFYIQLKLFLYLSFKGLIVRERALYLFLILKAHTTLILTLKTVKR
jgi:hypothetical protein